MTERSNQLPPAIFLMGPTASGKTGLAVELVARYPCEIISVDSAQVYRGLDIGSGKPDAETLRRAPHQLIDIRDPAESYSAAEFRDDALKAMAAISARGKVPLLVGGTMLYFKALRDGLSAMPPADPALRQRLAEEARREGLVAQHRRLAAVDPEAAARIRPSDPQRLQRALEVWELSGKPLSDWHRGGSKQALPYQVLQIGLIPSDRAVLHEQIRQRFTRMLAQGFVAEVRGLYARGDLNVSLPAIRSVGYRQIWQFLEGEFDEAAMVERGLAATRQLAKRQLTWLRSWEGLLVLDSLSSDLLDDCLNLLPPAPT